MTAVGDADRTHVAVIVGNDVTADSRVRKCVATLVEAGMRVTVLDHAPRGGSPPEIAGAEVVRPKVSTTQPVSSLISPQRVRELVSTIGRLGRFASDEQRRRSVLRRKLAERRAGARIAALKLALRRGDASGRIPATVWRRATALAIRALRHWLRLRRQLEDYRGGGPGDTRSDEEFPFASRSDGLDRRDVKRDWRATMPDVAAIELAFGPVLDRLEPDIIHAHDHLMVPVAAEAVLRARAAGRDTRWIYDAHEYVRGLTTLSDDRRRAVAAAEARFLPSADAIITVSPALADRLREDHGLRTAPTVVLNAPHEARPRTDVPDLRTVVGVGDVRLLVYSGNVTPARGVHTLIDAMAELPSSVHLALVVGQRVAYLDRLLERAVEAGTRDRIHLAPYVEPDQVAAYLSVADLGVHPMRRYPNGDIALPNKLFEYLHARLPVVVSDCPAQAAMVQDLGFGRVFRADDPSDLARSVAAALEERDELRAAITPEVVRRYSWEQQAEQLLELYADLGVCSPGGGAEAAASASSSEKPTRA